MMLYSLYTGTLIHSKHYNVTVFIYKSNHSEKVVFKHVFCSFSTSILFVIFDQELVIQIMVETYLSGLDRTGLSVVK